MKKTKPRDKELENVLNSFFTNEDHPVEYFSSLLVDDSKVNSSLSSVEISTVSKKEKTKTEETTNEDYNDNENENETDNGDKDEFYVENDENENNDTSDENDDDENDEPYVDDIDLSDLYQNKKKKSTLSIGDVSIYIVHQTDVDTKYLMNVAINQIYYHTEFTWSNELTINDKANFLKQSITKFALSL